MVKTAEMAVQCNKCGHIMTAEEHENYPLCPMCDAASCTLVSDKKCECDCCNE